MNDNRGMTLIELIVVITVVGILIAAISTDFLGWRSKYKVESQMKEMYIDLMNARSRAMERNRLHFVTLTQSQYTINEDLDPWPDGDEILTSNDNNRPAGYNEPIPLLQKTFNPDYTLQIIGTGALPETVSFNKMGLASPEIEGFLYLKLKSAPDCCLSETCSTIDALECTNPDYDCMTIKQIKIRIGKKTSDGTACIEK